MEIIFEGHLERNNLSGSGKEWKRGYCLFRKHPTTGSKVLEFYKDSNWTKAEPKAVCNLLSEYDVSYVAGSTKKRFVFELRTVDQAYELGAPGEALRQQWIEALNNAKGALNNSSINNVIQTFNVVLINEDLVQRHLDGFTGTCQLMITDAEVVVVAAGQTKIRWKFSTIRRYKSQTGTFVIEVGRKAQTGDGEFRFDTSNPNDLFTVLEEAVKNRIRAKGIEISTLTPNNQDTLSPKVKLALSYSPPTVSRNGGRMGSPPANHRQFTADTEYSHLNQIKASTEANKSSDYDSLFNSSDRLRHQRKSEPVFPSPPFLNNTRKLTANTHISAEPPEEEMYEKMNAAAAAKAREQAKLNDRKPTTVARPLPVPRPKPALPPVNAPPKLPLTKSRSTPLEDSTYDNPNSKNKNTSGKQNLSIDKEYDSLFNKANTQTSSVGEEAYSHLNHTTLQQPTAKLNPLINKKASSFDNDGSVNDQTYDIPKPKISNMIKKSPPPQPSRKPVARPQRSAPLPPPGRAMGNETKNKLGNHPPLPSSPGRPSKNLNNSAGATDSLIMQLKQRNLGLGGNKPDINDGERLYDNTSSVTAPEGYNVVGDVLLGEYRPLHSDADGYVTVPESRTEDDIYQVPK